ncbi:hypothetical protein FBU59_003974 [Linderina macrospora]|uniref:Uncharacterized protein n=1 Tax=Linderina macrospora TaxID=4868 RepID=A0ACC1J6R5_9FUNG|nr:hypothetical protein FBU59_003974 [Linderina macrospora]
MSTTATDSPTRTSFKGADTLGANPQQSILNVLRVACAPAMQRADFASTLQTIKQQFFVRDFNSIFQTPTNLSVYTAQYVPRRALCYYEIFSLPELQSILKRRPTVYCLGAGSGSELVGISAASCTALGGKNKSTPITVHSQDYADWSEILQQLEDAVRYKWGLTDSHVRFEFSIGDLMEPAAEMEKHVQEAQLVTAMFVFNELFADKTKAMGFVKMLVKNVQKGGYFLLVDSAGSFSSVQVGGKNYMSYMFFDSLKQFFEPVVSEDSRWFRHASNLEYPLSIENMRYFIRLYRRK